MYKNRAGDGLYSMPADAQNTEAEQEMYHTACRHMHRGKAGDGSYSMPGDGQRQGRAGNGSYSMLADGQRKGRRWIIQHAGRWTEAGQKIVHAVSKQINM
jgi:hypothetical protein